MYVAFYLIKTHRIVKQAKKKDLNFKHLKYQTKLNITALKSSKGYAISIFHALLSRQLQAKHFNKKRNRAKNHFLYRESTLLLDTMIHSSQMTLTAAVLITLARDNLKGRSRNLTVSERERLRSQPHAFHIPQNRVQESYVVSRIVFRLGWVRVKDGFAEA